MTKHKTTTTQNTSDRPRRKPYSAPGISLQLKLETQAGSLPGGGDGAMDPNDDFNNLLPTPLPKRRRRQ